MTPTLIIKRFIVLGDAGAGKSSFINFLFNYLNGTKHPDEIFCEHPKIKIAIPCVNWIDCLDEKYKNNKSEHNINDQTQSQTQLCTTYTISRRNEICLEIIDTPGFNDTNGTDEDTTNLTMIEKALKEVPFLSGIIMVVNGSSPRLGVSFKNFLHMLHQIWPDNLMNNCVAILTNCDELSVNLDSSVLKRDLNVDKSKTFHLQNSLFRWNRKLEPKKTVRRFQQDFEDNLETIKVLLNKLQEFEDVSTKSFSVGAIKILLIEQCIQQCIHNMVDLLEKYKEQQVTEAGIEGARDTMKNNKQWEKQHEIHAIRWVEAPRGRSPSPTQSQPGHPDQMLLNDPQESSPNATKPWSANEQELNSTGIVGNNLVKEVQAVSSSMSEQLAPTEADQLLLHESQQSLLNENFEASKLVSLGDHDLQVSTLCVSSQIDEKFSPGHDDQHCHHQITTAASGKCNAMTVCDNNSVTDCDNGKEPQYDQTASERELADSSGDHIPSTQKSFTTPYSSNTNGLQTSLGIDEKHHDRDSTPLCDYDDGKEKKCETSFSNKTYGIVNSNGSHRKHSYEPIYQQEQTKIQVTLPDNEAVLNHKYAQKQEFELTERACDLQNEKQTLKSSMILLTGQLKQQVAELRSINTKYDILEQNCNLLMLFKNNIKLFGDDIEMLSYYNETVNILSR